MVYMITINGTQADMKFGKGDPLANNVYLSLMIKKGSFFLDPEFGSNLHLLKRSKNTERTAAQAREYCLEALQWIKDMGRAKAIEVYTQIDKLQDLHRLKILVQVTKMNDEPVVYELFKEVV